MNTLTIIDTDILIDVALKVRVAIDCLAQIEQQSILAVSAITSMEILVGCRNKVELKNTERFLQRFQVIKLNETISDVAIKLIRQYRLSHGLLLNAA